MTIPAYITRLMTFAQHGEPKSYAASDMMRADLDALIGMVGCVEPVTMITAKTKNRHVSPGIPLGHELQRLRKYDEAAAARNGAPCAATLAGCAPECGPDNRCTSDVQACELPDAIRVPLDELEADARYLAARLANGTMAPSVGAEAIQKRTRAIREALLAHGVNGLDGGQPCEK